MTTLQVSFTFQSGSIQMYFHLPCMYSHTALHSNLVLFKYGRSKKEFYNSYTFTFQSGSIQIKRVFLTSAISIPFTFQSGSIQIELCPVGFSFFNSLHSNLVLFKYTSRIAYCSRQTLYIPIWFYSNAILR